MNGILIKIKKLKIMKIPKKVKVGGLYFTIIESQDVANQGGVFGSTHFRQQKIFLEKSETQQMKEATFWHEVLHTLMQSSGLTKIMEDKEKKLTEEEIVCHLDDALYAFLIDNKLLK